MLIDAAEGVSLTYQASPKLTLTLSVTGGSGTGAVSYSVESGTCTLIEVDGVPTLRVDNRGPLGACVVRGDKATDSNYLATTDTSSVEISRAAQAPFTVDTSDADEIVTYAPAGATTVTLSTSGGTEGEISYAVVGAESNCSISGTTVTVDARGDGECVIRATRAQTDDYQVATTTVALTILRADQAAFTVDTSDADEVVTYAPAGATTVTLSTSGGTEGDISYAVVDAETNCSIIGSTLTVETRGDGQCVVRATRAQTSNYNATSATVTLSIDKAVQAGFTARINGSTAGATVAYTSPTLATASLDTINAAGGGTVNFAESDVDCVVGTGSVTISQVGDGACLLTATSAESENYLEATDTVLLTIVKGSQTLVFADLGDKTYGDAPFLLTASSESGDAIVFNTTSNSVCTINDETDTLTIVGVGTCAVTVDEDGNANYLSAARVTKSFAVVKSAQIITWETIEGATYGQLPFLLDASASSGGALTYASSTTGVCTVSGATLTIVAAGTCSVAADQSGSENFLAATTYTQTFTIAKASQTIEFGLLSNQTLGSLPFSVSATASSGLSVSFSSTTTGVCTVAGSTVTLVAAGTCTIRPAQSGNDNYLAAANNDRNFTVTKGNQALTFASVSPKTFGDADFNVTATSTAGLTPSYVSTTLSICTVTSSGTVTILRAGSCTITANQAGNANFNPATQVAITITVAKATQIITFNPLSDQTLGASAITLSATSTSGLAVSFASKTTGVCTVSGNTLTILTAGTCTITASQSGNANNNNAIPVDRSFTVTAAPQTITFEQPADVSFDAGTVTLVATTDSNLIVTLTSQTPLVCSVNGDVATLLDGGTCTIRASQAGSADYAAAADVDRTFAVSAGLQVIEFAELPSATFGDAPFLADAFSSAGFEVTFTSSTTLVCTVTSAGTITIVGAGTCTIAADVAAGNGYLAADQVAQEFTVAKAAQASLAASATPTVIALSAGTGSTTLSTTGGSGSGAVSYAIVSGGTASCSITSATLTATTVGTCIVQATKAESANHLVATSANLTITVQAVPLATARPAITGTKAANANLSVTVGTWTGTPTPTTSIQWYRCTSADTSAVWQTGETVTGCTLITGATAAIYKLPATIPAGSFYRARITATNTIGGVVRTAYAWSQTK